MKNNPVFTIILPAKGRPELIRDALFSVLEQSFTDYELIISNNGADPAIKDRIADKLSDPRILYTEQTQVLAMPEHWEKISLLARGKYLTILTDRSVLKQGALEKIAQLHQSGGSEAAIITWPWDLYFDSGYLLPLVRGNTVKVLKSVDIALESVQDHISAYPFKLPRGLNSSVSVDIIKKIRDSNGTAFSKINPDFSFAYDCLLSHSHITHIDKSLMISQGLKQSNGGNAYITNADAYIKTLNLKEPIRYSPIKEFFVENIIIEDFLSSCHRHNCLDLLEKFDLSYLYIKCFNELEEKQAAKILSPQHLSKLKASIETALENEPQAVIDTVNIHRKRPNKPTMILRKIVKKKFGKYIEWLRPIALRLQGAKRFHSVLQAAGHISE